MTKVWQYFQYSRPIRTLRIWDEQDTRRNCSVKWFGIFVWRFEKKTFWDWATFKDVRKEGYFSACEKNCRNGPFCNCVEAYKDRFILQAEASIKKYVEQIVRVSDSYPYILDDQGEVDWSPSWTFPNALLFTMTTLTLIGKVEI